MVRVSHPKPIKQASRFDALRGAKVSKQRNRHKLVFEDTDQKKQKSLFFKSDPPPGYTFIPAGNPQLTEALKEFSKKSNQEIFAVTTTPHASRHELSREVHRIGWHFPTEVVARVCSYYGIRLTASGRLVEDEDDDKLFMKVYQKGQLVLDEKVRDQVTINTEAKQIIKDLFPNIPDNDLFKIIKTAFQVGDGKVGTADEIPLVRRAQLSVVAHVRHTYTNYDKLLRQVPYSDARHSVESETLKKLIEWRGDDDNKDAVEDTLREVVVISDEDDSDDGFEDGQILDHEDVRVQVVSSAARHDQPFERRPYSPDVHYPGNSVPGTFRYVPQVAPRIRPRDQSELIAAQQQSRYAVWDRYQQEYRAAVAPQSSRVIERILIEEPSNVSPALPSIIRDPAREIQRIVEQPVPIATRPPSPTYIRGADGRLYERVIVPSNKSDTKLLPRRAYTPPPQESSRMQYVRSRPVTPRSYSARVPLHRRTFSVEDGDATVVQSIEGSNNMYQSPDTRLHHYESTAGIAQKRHSDGYFMPISEASHNDFTRNMDYGSKRQRQDDSPPSPFLQHRNRTSFLARIDTQQITTRAPDDEYAVRPAYEHQDTLVNSSPRNVRQRATYDQPFLSNGSLRTSAIENANAGNPLLQATQGEQNRSRYAEPPRDEYSQQPIRAIADSHFQQSPYPKPFQRVPQSHNPHPARYIRLGDDHMQRPNTYYSEQNPVQHMQTDQLVPTNVVRRASGLDQVHNMPPHTVVLNQSTAIVPQLNRHHR